MIDVHAHVLPGIDDGPGDMAESVALARAAAAAGIDTIVATPHLRADHPDVVPGELAGRVAEVQAALDGAGVALRVLPGAEVDLLQALERDDADLRQATLGANGRDLLIETPHGAMASIFEDAVLGLLGRGFRVTLAHPELMSDPVDRLAPLAEAGVLFQLTAASVDRSRRRPRGHAHELLRRGWVHLLATDAHAVAWRPPELGPGLDGIAALWSPAPELARWLTEAVPAALVAAKEIPPCPVAPPAARRRRWGLR